MGTPDQLSAGEYRLELAVPDWLLDRFNRERDAMLAAAQAALRLEWPTLTVTGGGVQHSTLTRRVLVLTVEIKPAAAGEAVEAAFVGVAIRVAAILATVAVSWAITSAILSVERIMERVPDDAIEDGAEGFKNLVSLAKTLVLGGGLVWLLVWIAGDEKGGQR